MGPISSNGPAWSRSSVILFTLHVALDHFFTRCRLWRRLWPDVVLEGASVVGRHASAAVREQSPDDPQQRQEDAEDAEQIVALAEGHQANGEDEDQVQDSEDGAPEPLHARHCYRLS